VDRRIAEVDGAGVVDAVGRRGGVPARRTVVSCFFPQWQDGLPSGTVANLASTPGDGLEALPRHFRYGSDGFTHAPRVGATPRPRPLPTAVSLRGGRWRRRGKPNNRRYRLSARTGGVHRPLQIREVRVRRLWPRSSSERSWNTFRTLGANCYDQ